MEKAKLLLTVFIFSSTIWQCSDLEQQPMSVAESELKASGEDSMLDSIDNMYNLYYDYVYDSTYIMTQLDQFEEEVTENFGINSLVLAGIIHTKGKVLNVEGDIEGAIKEYEKSLTIKNKILPPADPEIAKSNQNLSLCYFEKDDYYKALDYSFKAIRYPDELSPIVKAPVYQQISRVFKRVSDLDNAKIYLENAISIFEREVDKSDGKEKSAWEQKLGLACIDMATLRANRFSDPKGAIPYLETALSIFGSITTNERDFRYLADTYHTIGIAFDRLNDPTAALHYYNRSLYLNQMLKGREGDIARNKNNLGIVYKRIGQLDKAKAYSFQALKYYNAETDQLEIAQPLDNLGDIYVEEGSLDKALNYYNRANKNIVAEFPPSSIQENPSITSNYLADKQGLFISLSSKAVTMGQKYEQLKDKTWLLASLDAYLKVDTLIDLMRLEFRSDGSKESLVEKTKPIYEKAINLCFEMEKIFQDKAYWGLAFHFAEKSKSIILLEAVRKEKARVILDEALMEKEREMNLKRTFYEKEYALTLMRKEKKSQISALLDSLSKYRTKYNDVLNQIRQVSPSFQSLKNTSTLDWQYVQNYLLKEGQTFIEYFIGEKAIYAFVIGKDYFRAVKITINSQIESLVQQLTKGILEEKKETYANPALDLYTILFEDIQKVCSLENRLIIVPDGILSYIPFEALLYKKIEDALAEDFPKYPYLLTKYNISYNYSATLWDEMNKNRNKHTGINSYIGFAPSFAQLGKIEYTDPNLENFTFGNLKHNVEEVTEIKELIGGKVFVNKMATATNFIKYAPEYKIIHLSTHGEANLREGDLSFLLFDKNEEGLYEQFFCKDLYSMKLQANMVVLSACETNKGELRQGEGIISLARGFSYAGAGSILTTLWTIDDETSKHLIIGFYQNLYNNLDKAEALYKAKLAYLNRNHIPRKSHPFYWASFIPIGNMEPLSFDN